MNHHIVHLSGVLRVLLCAEPRKALLAQVDLQWAVACDEAVQTQIELLATDQQRAVDVLTDHVRLTQVDLVLRE